MKTICLNMIVKNESRVITRCLTSVLPLIDAWVITDTGSEDGTQQIITDFFREKEVPGKLFQKPWINFATNRNWALDLAKGYGDYLLFADADEYFTYDENFQRPPLDLDCYYFSANYAGLEFLRKQLVLSSIPWRWEGIVHEVIDAKEAKTSSHWPDVMIKTHQDGARSSDPEKYRKDIRLLELSFKEDPNNRRTAHFLAQSYRDAGEPLQAIKNYEKALEMDPSPLEAYAARMEIADLQRKLDLDPQIVVKSYLEAHFAKPGRKEPLHHLAHYFRSLKDYKNAYITAEQGYLLPDTHDLNYVLRWIYDYGMALEYSIDAYAAGHIEESKKAAFDLFHKKNLPPGTKEALQSLWNF